MKIRNKISLIFAIEFIIIVSIIGFLVISFSVRLIKNQVLDHLETTAQSRADHIETYLNQSIERLKLVNSRTKLRSTLLNYNQQPNQDDLEAIKGIILDAIQPIDDFERICILNQVGQVIISTKDEHIGRDCGDKSFFLEAKSDYRIFFQQEEDQLKIYVAGPLFLGDQFLGVGMTVISLDYLNSIADNKTGLGQGGEVLIAFIDEQENLRFLNRQNIDHPFIELQNNQPMREALAGRAIKFDNQLDYRGQKVLAASQYIELAGLGLVAKIDQEIALKSITNLSYLIIGLIILSIFVYYIIGLFSAQKVISPVNELYQGIKSIEKGDYSYSLDIKSKDEIEELADSFNLMVASIKKSRTEIDQKVAIQTKEISQRAKELDDQQKAILNILEDVDEEKNTARNLAKDLEKFKLAVDNASDHIIITNPEGIVLYANQAVEVITGFSVSQILNKKAGTKELWGGLMEESFYQLLWKTIKEDKKTFIGDIKNKRKNGQEYNAAASISPVVDREGQVKFFVGVERDVTREREVDQAKTEFVSLASHQLRTPLSAISWYTEMLLAGDAGKLTKSQKEYLKEIYQGNQRMIDLVNALLNVSRLELGTFAVEPQNLNLVDIVQTVLKELKAQIDSKKLKLEEDFDQKTIDYLADPELMRILFQNLISNAVKYTPAEGQVKIAIQKNKSNLVIKVTDSGYGIPQAQQSKIFNKLFRADNIKEKDTEGTGLGLYIVKSIVDHNGGQISFKSEENKGSSFLVELPLTGMVKKEGSRKLTYRN